MATADRRLLPESRDHHYCVYASRRDEYRYLHSHEEILAKYGEKIVMCERMPELMWATMGNQMYTAHAADFEAAQEFIRFVHQRQ